MTGRDRIDDEAAGRRVLDRLDSPTKVPVLGLHESDLRMLLAGGVGGILAGSIFFPDTWILPMGLVGLALAAGTISVAPADRSVWDWLRDIGLYLRRRTAIDMAGLGADDPGGGDRGSVRLDADTQELTGFEAAWPGVSVVERPDGTLEAWLELEPGHMEFALADDWGAVQSAAAEFASDDLDFELVFHATTRAFPVEDVVAELEERLQDPDVRANPALRRLLEEYRETRPAEMRERGTQQIRYYLSVTVEPGAVLSRYRDAETPLDRLRRLPGVRRLVDPLAARRLDLSEAELREECRSELDERVRTVRSGLVDRVPEWSARRLSSVEMLGLAGTFWNGEPPATGTAGTGSGHDESAPARPVIGRRDRARNGAGTRGRNGRGGDGVGRSSGGDADA